MTLSRRTFLAGSAAVAAATVAAPYVHAQKRGGTLEVRAARRPQDPRPDLDDGVHHAQSRLHDLRHAVRARRNLKLQPQMVDKYTVSKDAMKYSFTLRDGLKFHDGAAGDLRGLRGLDQALGRQGRGGPAHDGLAVEDGARRQEDVRHRAGDAVRPRARRAGQALGQPVVHHAGAPGRHRSQRAGQGSHRLRPLQVLQGRVAAGQPRRLRAQRRLRAAQGEAERGGRRQAGAGGPGGVALHPRSRHRRRRAGGRRSGLLGERPARLRAAPGEERQHHRVRHRPQGQSGHRAARTTCIRHSTTRRRGRRCCSRWTRRTTCRR